MGGEGVGGGARHPLDAPTYKPMATPTHREGRSLTSRGWWLAGAGETSNLVPRWSWAVEDPRTRGPQLSLQHCGAPGSRCKITLGEADKAEGCVFPSL